MSNKKRPIKKILFYCQHVLGMGHLMRSRTLVEGLADFQVCFVNGGEMIPGLDFPPGVEVVQLPPLQSDAEFQHLTAVADQDLADVKATRAAELLLVYARFQPEAVIIELFPFGRKKFAFELLPLLDQIRSDGRSTPVICSLRDILVSRADQEKYEARVISLMHQYFDALLVHADPRLQRLEETFQRVADLGVPILYTGYVAQVTPSASDELALWPPPNGHPRILASIGGGRVGYELLTAAIAASTLLQADMAHQLLIFTGPFLPADQLAHLQAQAATQPQINLQQYTAHFLAYMEQADLSLSLAGYNTCMNLLTTGVPALVLPFTGGGNDEQTIRARKLAAMGRVGVLQPAELEPHQLAARIKERLQLKGDKGDLDINGAENTAVFLRHLQNSASDRLHETPKSHPVHLENPVAGHLRETLEQLQANGRPVHLFLRDDDVDQDEGSLRHLLDICLVHDVPLNLELIPGRLTPAAVQLLKEHKSLYPALIELHQHGWLHVNHEPGGRKCEFGPSRTLEQQQADIARGKALLEELFGGRFYPAFTPPWNRCTADTFAALDQLGFAVLSKDQQEQPITGYSFREISTTLDIFTWRTGTHLKPADELVMALVKQISQNERIGLLLHHKVMDTAAFAFLDQLLAELRRHPHVHFHTFESLQNERSALSAALSAS